MPLEANYSINQATVTPWPKSVAKVKFEVSSVLGEAIQISFADGRFLPVGSSFALGDSRVVVGADGLAYLETRPESGKLTVNSGKSECTFTLPARDKSAERSDVVRVVCEGAAAPK